MYFALLGSLVVGPPASPIPITAAKQRAVVAALVLEPNQEVPAERLLASVWGQRQPASAQSTLQSYIYRLRQRLRPLPQVMLRTRSSGYVLVLDPAMTDVWSFRDNVARARGRACDPDGAIAELRAGLALWRGPALSGIPGALLRQEARVLEQERILAYEDLFAAELARGNSRAIIPELEKVAATYPLHERLRAQLMLALYRSGRQAESLQAYSMFQRRLRDDLGIEPATELRDLHQAILRQVPGDRLVVRHAPEESRIRAASSRPPSPRSPSAVPSSSVPPSAHRTKEPLAAAAGQVPAATATAPHGRGWPAQAAGPRAATP